MMIRRAGGRSPRRGAAFVPVSSPIPAPGALIVYDFSVRPSLTIDGSGNIAQANDLSGNGNHATQTTAANRPNWNSADASCNNLGTCNPTSGTPQLNLPAGFLLVQPYTVIVLAVTGATGFQQIIANPGPTFQLTSSGGATMFAQVAGDSSFSGAVTTTAKHIYMLQGASGGGTSKLFVDSSSSATLTHAQVNTSSSGTLSLCSNGSSFLFGSIAYVAVFPGIVSGASTVNGLGTRYGIAVT